MPEVLDAELDEQLSCVLHGAADLEAIRQVLVLYRDKGFSAQAVYRYLGQVRAGAVDAVEDRILEAMDIASGYCPAGCRVWDTAR
ncbi:MULTISPECIES: hypothetical protein [unclassified Pseudomonas]|uniref:hypothetical protein n=1 Tax=unclassified Pseudomonas TaxID=196821 RepID=UPI000838751F|nr:MULTISPECIES: hypothetical protein [unclassified Pseudomonas]QIH06273.1 hypothetical protein ATY02_06000 [Pseudomonas sp. BIOMIG1BAC]